MALEEIPPANGAENHQRKSHIQALQTAPGIKGKKITSINEDGMLDFIQSLIFSQKEAKEPFYILDLGHLMNLMEHWNTQLPMICPYYAVKCNTDQALLGALAAIGSSFDCATQVEIDSILALGVSPNRIIFANPCKLESHIKYAAYIGINLTTFDSITEVEKIKRCHPKSSLLIRIKVDDSAALFPLSSKYGAFPEEIVPLLQAAQAAHLTVSGVSFHIGSKCNNPQAYRAAIAAAKEVFDTAVQLDMPRMNILNIGGGFTSGPQFDEVAAVLKAALKEYFSEEELTVIAEPGTFFAEKIFTLATNIFGKRIRGKRREYWISDGVYGSLNCIINANATVTCIPLASRSNPINLTLRDAEKYETTVFGPTCDAGDTISTSYWLPELEVDDWLVFPNMGAYSSAIGSNFNGFITSAIPTHLVN